MKFFSALRIRFNISFLSVALLALALLGGISDSMANTQRHFQRHSVTVPGGRVNVPGGTQRIYGTCSRSGCSWGDNPGNGTNTGNNQTQLQCSDGYSETVITDHITGISTHVCQNDQGAIEPNVVTEDTTCPEGYQTKSTTDVNGVITMTCEDSNGNQTNKVTDDAPQCAEGEVVKRIHNPNTGITVHSCEKNDQAACAYAQNEIQKAMQSNAESNAASNSCIQLANDCIALIPAELADDAAPSGLPDRCGNRSRANQLSTKASCQQSINQNAAYLSSVQAQYQPDVDKYCH